MTAACTGVGCPGCEAGRRHYAATGCTVAGCTDEHLWLDGDGLDPVTARAVAETGATVHLRVRVGVEAAARYPVVACARVSGDLVIGVWTGRLDEATCPACLEAAPS